GAGAKSAVDQIVPALAAGFADLGVTVAGQVHKIAVVHLVKVDGGRLARRAGHPGQVFAVAQLIDEAGLAHVGPAREADLRPAAVGQLAGNAVACQKSRFVVVHVLSLQWAAGGRQQTTPGCGVLSAGGGRMASAALGLRARVRRAGRGLGALSRATSSTWARVDTGTNCRFCLTSSSTSYRSLSLSLGIRTSFIPSR